MTKNILIVSPIKKRFAPLKSKLKKLGFIFVYALDLENAQLNLLRSRFSLVIIDLDYYRQQLLLEIVTNMANIAPFQFIIITNRSFNIKFYKGLKVIMQGPINDQQLATHILAHA